MCASDLILIENHLPIAIVSKYETRRNRRQDREGRAAIWSARAVEGCNPCASEAVAAWQKRRQRAETGTIEARLTINVAWFRVPAFGMLVRSIGKGNPVRFA
jgi:hypothetical protein